MVFENNFAGVLQSGPAYFTYNNATYYYVTNLQGDVVAILDSTGAVMVNYHYDAYGVLLQTGGTMAATLGTLNPLTYRGYVYDHETSLYYLQSRYYNPTFRQFISPDAFVSTGQGFMGYNMFAYCGNNPVNYSDPTGTMMVMDKKGYIGLYLEYISLKDVVNFFSPSTNTISGQFQDGILRGSGSLTGGYSEINGRLQVNSKDSKNNGLLGGFAKVSAGNAAGKISVGNNNATLSLKGVGDVLTATAQAGMQYKNGAGIAANVKAAVLSGRVTAELEFFGWQIEFGVSGDLYSAGAEAMIGVFPDEGFTAKASASAGPFGAGFVFRLKPAQ